VIVIVWPTPEPALHEPTTPTIAMGEEGSESTADLLAAQFEMLAPSARDGIARSVDESRGTMRDDLLALAVAQDKSAGGAP
jgi:hypothetical protein